MVKTPFKLPYSLNIFPNLLESIKIMINFNINKMFGIYLRKNTFVYCPFGKNKTYWFVEIDYIDNQFFIKKKTCCVILF